MTLDHIAPLGGTTVNLFSSNLADTFQATHGGANLTTITVAQNQTVQNFWMTPGIAVAPTITSVNTATFTVGSAGSFTVTTTGTPTPSLSISGSLPAGVTFTDNGDGTATLSSPTGPSAAGTASMTITAANGVGSNATQAFTITDDASGSHTLLQASDFLYKGYILVNNTTASGINYGQGFTSRRVGGQLRFITTAFTSSGASVFNIVEFQPPSISSYTGSYTTPLCTVTSANLTNTWAAASVFPIVNSGGWWIGLWWEDSTTNPWYSGSGRMWLHCSQDYPGSSVSTYPGLSNGQTVDYTFMASAIAVCNLDSIGSGTVSNFTGFYGFENPTAMQANYSLAISSRCVTGCTASVPSWIQTTYGLKPYMYGFGGYYSKGNQGGTISQGLIAVACNDLTTITTNTNAAVGNVAPLPYTNWTPSILNGTGADWTIPNTAIQILADHRSGEFNAQDNYASGMANWDRGARLNTTPIYNYFDGGENYTFPGTVSVNIGSTSVTFGTAQTPSAILGNYLHCIGDSDQQRYLFTSNTDNQHFTLATSYAGVANQVNSTGATVGYPGNGIVSDAAEMAWYSSHTPFPKPDGQWLSPAPDGYGRFVGQGDRYYSSGLWIDGPSKQGFLTCFSGQGGWSGYVNSHGGNAYTASELHVFDPADFGAVVAATKNPWNVQPKAFLDLTPDVTALGGCNPGINSYPQGITFDLSTKLLYVYTSNFNNASSPNVNFNVILVYQVNC